jgi:endonuclease/exonuclease/phosphatase (EEP) superfamily protein YafD
VGASLLASGGVKAPQLPGAGEPSVTILTYNLNYGMAGDTEIIGAIRRADADLVLLQETSPEWEEVLRRTLSPHYPHMSFRHCCLAGGLAVLSKTAFQERDYVTANNGWFPAWRLIVESSLGPLQVLNVHLRPPVSDSGSVVSGYFTTPAVREREIQQYHALLEPGLPTLVAGDFNENTSGRAVSYLQQRGFRSAVPEFHPDADTWRWHTRLGTIRAELDHIVYNPALSPLNAQVLEWGRSDHFPLLATFRPAPAEPVRAAPHCGSLSSC